MSYILPVLVLVAMICFGYGIRFIALFHRELVDRFSGKKLHRYVIFLLLLPVIVILIVSYLIVFVWQTEPVLRFVHMLWVLGLWMLGTLCIFVFLLSARLKLNVPIFPIIFPLVIIPVAIYSTPLPVFHRVFDNKILIPAIIGILNIIMVWIIEFRLLKLINPRGEN